MIYRGELVCYEGALYQARQDTAQVPGGSEWACVVRGGIDGKTLVIRGKFDTRVKYKQLDISSLDGSTYIALRDNPGIPGSSADWQVLALHGMSGAKGPRGERGDRGERREARGERLMD